MGTFLGYCDTCFFVCEYEAQPTELIQGTYSSDRTSDINALRSLSKVYFNLIIKHNSFQYNMAMS